MGIVNLTLSDDMKAWVDDQARASGYASDAEFIRALIGERRAATERLRALVIEGIESGPGVASDEVTRQMRAKIKAWAS